MAAILTLLAGTFYGLIIGLIPSAGATTGLVAMFGFISYFGFDQLKSETKKYSIFNAQTLY